jgi:hypothetical protein
MNYDEMSAAHLQFELTVLTAQLHSSSQQPTAQL